MHPCPVCDLAALVPRDAASPAGRLLIAALRCHAAGAGCDLLGFFELALTPAEARPAARALAGFARALIGSGRRPPRFGLPGDPPTPDEAASARLVDALADDDAPLAGALLAWLARPDGRAPLLAAAAALAARLAGHRLPAAAE